MKSLVERLRRWTGIGPRNGPSPSDWKPYAREARRLGLSGPTLFLSFDCDTVLDAAAAGEVHGLLTRLGLKMTLAVPGTQLRESAAVYRGLSGSGVEFMNHGMRSHAQYLEDRYVAATFYDQMPPEEVVEDIRLGHAAVVEVTGLPPLGFRAPHFGSYQAPEQLDLIHRTARDLGYSYCSTTLPQAGLARGPAYPAHGLAELPVMGSARHPLVILDSWNYLSDRKDYRLSPEYLELFEETVRFLFRHDIPALLTWYADPAHVAGQSPFIKAMELVAGLGIRSCSGGECAAMLRPRLGG